MRVRDAFFVALLASMTFGGTFTCHSDFDDDDDHRHHHRDKDFDDDDDRDVVIIRGSESSGESGDDTGSK